MPSIVDIAMERRAVRRDIEQLAMDITTRAVYLRAWHFALGERGGLDLDALAAVAEAVQRLCEAREAAWQCCNALAEIAP